MTVFDAFQNAIEQHWQIVPMAYSSITGNELDEANAIDIGVIVDEGSASNANQATSWATISSDTLIYARPDELPTVDTSALVADYAIRDICTGKIYEIIDAGLGKNQETGEIEHVEMKIRQVGEAND